MTRLNGKTTVITGGVTGIGRVAAKRFIESDEADLDRLYAAVKAERGSLDIVFANAGVGSQLRLGEIIVKHIDETFDINVKGTITVQKAEPDG